jgi:hypothetical protein
MNIEPLEPASWFRAISKLSVRIEASGSADQESLLRHAYHLAQLTPRPLSDNVRPDLEESRYEQLLECKAFASAALGIVGYPMTYAIFRREAECVVAQVCLPGQQIPTTARSPDIALAVLGAWSRCLVDLEKRSASPERETPREFPHIVHS